MKAFKTQLQLDKPCCDCGKLLPKDQMAVLCSVTVEVSYFLVGHLIAWCDPCWKEFAGHAGESIEVFDAHAKTQKIPT